MWNALHDLAHGLDYLHSVGIIHRDVKCKNVLIGEDGVLKIGDLGLAVLEKDEHKGGCVGTKEYIAPEVLREEKYDSKIDIWGLGCVIYYLAALKHPFYDDNYLTLTRNILHKDPEELFDYSYDFAELIQRMLSKSPIKRPTSKELLKEIHKKVNCNSGHLHNERFQSVQNSRTLTISSCCKLPKLIAKELQSPPAIPQITPNKVIELNKNILENFTINSTRTKFHRHIKTNLLFDGMKGLSQTKGHLTLPEIKSSKAFQAQELQKCSWKKYNNGSRHRPRFSVLNLV